MNSVQKIEEMPSLICKYQPSAPPWEIVCGSVCPGHRRIAEFTSVDRLLVIADGVQASIPAVGMAVISAGARVAIKDDEDWSLLAQDSSFYI
ncbi:hypothetical protein JAO85_13200 [Comamonas sp. NyZ500]|uniref:hypothetical protein n=1 Tax=Comamonas sp. NyZ500 TaxID=2795732 RepID=UPI00192C7765|nr:hypothetical protein [Comamonas sp. NyZ500]MBL5978241.1 hypothetical protein [Comamonas sp. NyZ500]